MIGLALVTLVAVVAAGITQSFRGAVDDLWISGYAITAQNNFDPIPIAAGNAAAHTPGVQAIANVRGGDALIFKKVHQATAVNPGGAQIFNIKWLDGGSNAVIAHLGAHGAFVDDNFAKTHHLKIGSPLTLTAPTGKSVDLHVLGIFKPPTGGSPFGPVTISDATWDSIYDSPQNLYSFVRMRGGETDAAQAALDKQLKAFPDAKVQTKEQFIDNQISGLNAILNVLYVLLALSVIVSLFGIVNTLVLTVFERTREIGMLRAVGMTRRQVRRMIRAEAVHHRSDGRRDRDRPRPRARRPPRGAHRLHRLRAAVGAGDRLRHGRDRRRPARGDLPGPPGRQAQRARSAPVRVGGAGRRAALFVRKARKRSNRVRAEGRRLRHPRRGDLAAGRTALAPASAARERTDEPSTPRAPKQDSTKRAGTALSGPRSSFPSRAERQLCAARHGPGSRVTG